MTIAVDISPISIKSTSAHKVRGVGMYINLLVDNLQKFDKKNNYIFVEDGKFPKDVDLIHYPFFDPFFITLPVRSSTKFIVTVHDLTPLVFPQHFPVGVRGRLKWQAQKQLLRRAVRVIVDSNCSKKDVQKFVGMSGSRIDPVYLSVGDQYRQISDLSSVKKQYSLPDKFLLYVGDATWNKNIPNLVKAVKQTTYPLVMVGKVWENNVSNIDSNPWNNDLRKVLKEIGQDSQFIRLGFVKDIDLIKIYNAATCLLMPSFYEGFGLPVLEAMSCGCPVICSKSGSLEEVAANAAYYIEPNDPENIVEGIVEVAQNISLQKSLSGRGLAQAKKFTIEKTIKDTISSYESSII